MPINKIGDERISRAADILEQIKAVDEMIDLHNQKEDKEDFMLHQYQERRASFLQALLEILHELNIDLGDFAA